jgi:soluble lytic murein transglycosylase-like protein
MRQAAVKHAVCFASLVMFASPVEAAPAPDRSEREREAPRGATIKKVPAQASSVKKPAPVVSEYQKEQAMSPAQLIRRWKAPVAKASRRFGVPVAWINAVMRVESGGRTMLSENMRMVSSKGAMGIMQVMPGTYKEMAADHRLGPDAFNAHDNIHAGAAYLRWLKGKYAYPVLFAAYNAGPGQVDAAMVKGRPLPQETRAYVVRINAILGGKDDGTAIFAAPLTRPDGSQVLVDPLAVVAVRAVLPGEYAPEVQSVIRLGGRLTQGVREDIRSVTAAIRMRGGKI